MIAWLAEKAAQKGNAQNRNAIADTTVTTHGHMTHVAGAVKLLKEMKNDAN